MIRRFTPPDADARARAYLAQIARGQADSAEARLAPALAGPDAHAEFQKIQSVLRGTRFDSLHVVGAQVNTMNGVRHVNLSYEFRGPRGWVLASVGTMDEGGQWFVEGLFARAIPEPLERANAFQLAGKSTLHYLWLAAMAISFLVSLGTAVFMATRKRLPGRWTLALSSLVGLGGFSLNWSDGTATIRLVAFQILGVGAFKTGPGASWVLTFSLPLCAIIALLIYRRWRTKGDGASDRVSDRSVDPSDAQDAGPSSE
ncbi:MAG TPA: hypothetical protein VFH27_17750 [Longimicrobiaceae bacterium]|nr:hypothetical protein [Longimicrobiaceae bacterium]